MIRAIQKLTAPMQRRIRLMIGRCVIRLVNDAARVQGLQVTLLEGETRDAVERFQEYGFSSVPLPGAEGIMVSVSGNRDHGVVIAVEDRRYRLTGLAAGEVAMYDDQGQKVVLYRDRIEVEAPKVIVKSDNVHLGAEGGPRVARIGDRVNVGSGSSAGLWPIVEGATKVSAV